MSESVGTEKPIAWVPEPCRHRVTTPVDESLTGAIVAHLCLDCDAQLPADWREVPPNPGVARRYA